MAAKTSKRKTTSKSASGKKGGKKKTSGQNTKTEANGLSGEIVLLISLAVCILLLIGNFGIGGIVGKAVSSAMFGIFGWIAYLIPLLLFGGIAFVISNQGNRHAYIKLAAGIVMLLMICTFSELITNGYRAELGLSAYYKAASIHKNAGGLLGGAVVKIFCPLLGKAGTYVVTVILFLICLILITEKSLFVPLKKGGSRAYEDARRRREERRERTQIRRAEREEKAEKQEKERREKRAKRSGKVSGVSFDTTLVGKSPDVKELYAQPDIPASADSFYENEGPPADPRELFAMKPEEELPGHTIGNTAENTEEVTAETKETFSDVPKRSRKQKMAPGELQQEISDVEEQIQEQKLPEQKHTESGTEKDSYRVPPMSLLSKGKGEGGDTKAHLQETAMKLEQTLKNFGVSAHVVDASCGPAVTRYEIQPEQGVKVSKIVGLADDIKLNLAVSDLRIEAPIPGKAAVGIEVPNKENTPVMLRDLLESRAFQDSKSKISFAVGKDISGKTVVSDIAKMPHLLVAGATGSGKSVCINTLIISILYKASPEEVKLIMIDPKVVELSVYNGIPHLLIPVVTDPKKASGALNWAVAEMMKRYQLFAEFNVREIKAYNEKLERLKREGSEENLPKKMEQIVIIVDELADLMMVAPGEVEGAICRLAQLARAAGMHLVLATQRPSVNVITGLIKANMPSRIAFSTTSGIDSRTIIDMNGAEKLLGKGDMLFYPAGYPKPVRVQGSFVSDQEVQKVVDYLIEKNGNASYNEEIEEHVNENIVSVSSVPGTEEGGDDKDAYFADAGKLIIEKEKASIGMLQRMFKIGFNRAARIMDQLAEAGVVGGEEGTKPRKILMTMEEFEQYLQES